MEKEKNLLLEKKEGGIWPNCWAKPTSAAAHARNFTGPSPLLQGGACATEHRAPLVGAQQKMKKGGVVLRLLGFEPTPRGCKLNSGATALLLVCSTGSRR